MASTQPVLERLQAHISAVEASPTIPLEQRLFDEAELVLPNRLAAEELLSLVRQLSMLLPQLQKDPTPAVNLLMKLLGGFSFADILAFDPPVDFEAGLQLGEHMSAFNRLILFLLRKATANASDAATVASQPAVMLALVRLWLCTSDTGVASLSSSLLLDLLRVDQEIVTDPDAHLPAGGQGLVWKRLFGDRDVYAIFFEACALTGPSELQMSKNQRTLAQARLLEWMPKVGALDWRTISRSHHTEIESQYGGTLLQFAAQHMVDHKGDVLMHQCLIAFFSDLLVATRPPETTVMDVEDSAGLVYLLRSGSHLRTIGIYTNPNSTDPTESMFLYGPAANYIATYASVYPKHFRSSPIPKHVNRRLMVAFDLSAARWAHAESPKHDLHLVASLPRSVLLPTTGDSAASWRLTPLSLLPSKATNPDVLNTLATVFHGPEKETVTFPPGSPLANGSHSQQADESAAARTLYLHYLANNPSMWKDIVRHADTVALMNLALAAINCLISVITAKWSTATDMALPSSSIATPDTGYLAILSPPALEYALPYLLKPPQTFANLVGGRGDTESAAYKIAAAKYDALRALHGKLVVQVEQGPREGYEDILATLSKRLAEGPLSREGEVGGRIDTLEL